MLISCVVNLREHSRWIFYAIKSMLRTCLLGKVYFASAERCMKSDMNSCSFNIQGVGLTKSVIDCPFNRSLLLTGAPWPTRSDGHSWWPVRVSKGGQRWSRRTGENLNCFLIKMMSLWKRRSTMIEILVNVRGFFWLWRVFQSMLMTAAHRVGFFGMFVCLFTC